MGGGTGKRGAEERRCGARTVGARSSAGKGSAPSGSRQPFPPCTGYCHLARPAPTSF